MIGREISPTKCADYGPVRLCYSDRSDIVLPGHPVAKMQSEEFATNKQALERGKQLYGRSDFVRPFILGQNICIWQMADLQAFAMDRVIFAASVAGVFPSDLAIGPVDLQDGSNVPHTFDNLRDAIEAASQGKDAGAFITFDDGVGSILLLPDALAAIVAYLD